MFMSKMQRLKIELAIETLKEIRLGLLSNLDLSYWIERINNKSNDPEIVQNELSKLAGCVMDLTKDANMNLSNVIKLLEDI